MRLISISTDSLEPLTNATLEFPVHLVSKPCIDDSYVYLPTKVGNILAVEKYSGDIAHSLDLGSMMIMSDLYCDEKNLYCMGGLPLSNGAAISSDNFCLNILDKHSGKKLAQGQCLPSTPNLITVDDDIWCIAKREIHRYSKEAELKGVESTKYQSSYSPIITDSYVVAASKTGVLEIFDKDTLARHNNITVGRNSSPPAIMNNSLYWFLQSGVVAVDLQTSKVSKLSDVPNNIVSSTCLNKGIFFGCNSAGEIISVDVESGDLNRLKLSKSPLWKPVATNDTLFVASREHLYQIEVSQCQNAQ